MWLNQLQIAILEKDIDCALGLLDNIPKDLTPSELERARAFIEQLSELLVSNKSATKNEMSHNRKLRIFLENS